MQLQAAGYASLVAVQEADASVLLAAGALPEALLWRTAAVPPTAASRPTFDMKASRGALHILPVPSDAAAVKRMQKWLPKAYFIKIKPNAKLPGLSKGASVLGFDYTFWVHKDVKADVVYKVTKTMFDNAASFRSASPLWRRFSEKTMAKDLGVAYHPGAVKFYKEKGMWKR